MKNQILNPSKYCCNYSQETIEIRNKYVYTVDKESNTSIGPQYTDGLIRYEMSQRMYFEVLRESKGIVRPSI